MCFVGFKIYILHNKTLVENAFGLGFFFLFSSFGNTKTWTISNCSGFIRCPQRDLLLFPFVSTQIFTCRTTQCLISGIYSPWMCVCNLCCSCYLSVPQKIEMFLFPILYSFILLFFFLNSTALLVLVLTVSPGLTPHLMQALDKSKYRDALRAVRRYIPRLEQELEILRAQLKSTAEGNTDAVEGIQESDKASIEPGSVSNFELENSDKLRQMINDNSGCSENEEDIDSELDSCSDKLSDIFETDSDTEISEKEEKPLYLDEFDNFPQQSDGETDDFEEHLQQISLNSKNMKKDVDLPKFDEVDKIFLRAASFLKKKRK